MATAKDLRRLALALEGTTEAPHFDRAAFKVTRIYVTLAADGKTANFKLTPDEQDFKCMNAARGLLPRPQRLGPAGLDHRHAGEADGSRSRIGAGDRVAARTGKKAGTQGVRRGDTRLHGPNSLQVELIANGRPKAPQSPRG
jgi:hypothetical protein